MIIPASPHRLQTKYDASLVEEAVSLAIRNHPQERRFHRQRERIYDLSDGEEREKQFRELHAGWFLLLGLDRPLAAALQEQPLLLRATRGCRVTRAPASTNEGADLYGKSGTDQPFSILVRLQPGSFLRPEKILALLRHEFMHVADMLDPRVLYRPEFPRSEAGPAYDNLLRERYRVLWDTWIDGRLLRQGRAGEEARRERLAEFAAAFPMLGPQIEKEFSRWFHFSFHTHPEMLAFALNPTPGTLQAEEKPAGGRCPLCHFPTFAFFPNPEGLDDNVCSEIRHDFPQWRPEQGLCHQCADLYRSRPLSRAAEKELPGVRGPGASPQEAPATQKF